jgi:hypothetical protein
LFRQLLFLGQKKSNTTGFVVMVTQQLHFKWNPPSHSKGET